jgi:predicted Ser/Thr protein kinase
MSTCTACGTEITTAGRFCSSCGAPVRAGDEVATFDFAPSTPPRPSRPGSASASRPSSAAASPLREGRFLPGFVIAGRYRIITLLGKGGMGEVYRADDLTLGQPVALKFLPEQAAYDEAVLERFRNEVRIARRVSHPNVCRVYDVGEVGGQTFFTMEYVDGEDLASLLRRIGRLPQDKALDIARQLCAGLAAAHAKGVLHRDMKPANIMLDGRGQVVITDFGLAGIADQIQGAEVRSGTPAYMAPEQLEGKEVSVRSDIYALGVVLYEVFTGKRAFTETAAEALRGSRAENPPSRPSSAMKDFDPIVERVILRCLEIEPGARPATVLSIAAALPGGDPLAAALAAGETPSPQLVAASGETAGLRPRTAMTCMVAALIGFAFVVFLTVRNSALEKMGLDQSPEVLTQKARDMIGQLGYEKHPVDSAYGLYNNGDLIESIEKNDKPYPDWNRVLSARPSLLQYWYRQSPRYMMPTEFHDAMLTSGTMRAYDPPEIVSGMVNLELDPQGRLIYLLAIPPELESATSAPAATFDWNVLFAFAGLEQSQFQTVSPIWNSLAGGDTRVAWTGKWPGTTRPLRIEAASWRGKPVFFSLIGDWTKPERAKADEQTIKDKARSILSVVLLVSMVLGAVFLARRNYRLGRGDRAGAGRLALVMFGLEIILWLCRSHFVADLNTFFLFVLTVSTALCVSGTTWLLYLAVEPWVRKNWPQTIVSWSRLLSGQVGDPLVGRDILFGVILGLVWILIFQIRQIPMMHMGAAPGLFATEYLIGGRQALGAWLYQVPSSILGALQFFFLLLGLKVLLRQKWIAAIVFVALFSGLNSLGSLYPMVEVPAAVIVYSIAVVIVYRFGLVSLACAIFTVDMLVNVPFTADFSAWYMSTSIFALLSVVAMAGWGFYHSLGGEPLWRSDEAAEGHV